MLDELERRLMAHNALAEEPWQRADLGALRAVHRRGACSGTNHRVGVSQKRWALARVDAFLALLRNGSPVRPGYFHDRDLLPAEHPCSIGVTRADVITPSDISLLVGEAIPIQITRELEPEIRAAMEEFGTAALSEAGMSGSFAVVDARTVGYLTEMSATRVQAINATTRRQLQLQLAEGVLAGEGSEALGRRIRRVFRTATAARARLIARTETNAAANFVRGQAFDDAERAGVTFGKRWSATRDMRTRHNHRRLHGQIRKAGEPFRIPGTSKTAMYPGGFADVGENANCRCVILPVTRSRGDEALGDRDIPPSLDEMIAKWEARIELAARRAFIQQERAILRQLDARDRPAV
jgi:SPP1 gp7 family putative phage head morphogenesis protein